MCCFKLTDQLSNPSLKWLHFKDSRLLGSPSSDCIAHCQWGTLLPFLAFFRIFRTFFHQAFLLSHTGLHAWLVDISSWMPAHRFELITSDNNIVSPAQTTKHPGVIPGSKLSYAALMSVTKPSINLGSWNIARIFAHHQTQISLSDL